MAEYTGTYLYYNISTGERSVHEIPYEQYEAFLGGRGMGARLLWELLAPDTEPFSEDNVFILGGGPLTGTMAPGSGKHMIVTRSPETYGWLDSYSSGRVGTELRAAGYDYLVIRGRAEKPSVLVMNDDSVELQDAAEFWGKDAFVAEQLLHKKYGPEYAFLVIGPAGENLVRFAGINSEFYRQAARGGVGAVLGSKNLKAVAVRGTGAPNCLNPRKVADLTKKYVEICRTADLNLERMATGTPSTLTITSGAGMLPTRNFQRVTFEEGLGVIDGDGVRKDACGTRGCFGCFTPCSKLGKFRVDQPAFTMENTLEGPEYETASLLGSNLEMPDMKFVLEANYECDRLGLDTIAAGVVVGFIIECLDRGFIQPEDIGELRPEFGKSKDVFALLQAIAYRKEGLWWAGEGVKRLSEHIGQGSEEFAIHCKGMEFPGYDPRGAYGCGLTLAVNPRGACHRRAWPPMELWCGLEPASVDGKAAFIKGLFDGQTIVHSIMLCDFPGSAIPLTTNDYLEYYTAATGIEVSEQDGIQISERTETLIRMLNNRFGKTRADDQLPARIINEAPKDGPAAGKAIGYEAFNRMLSEYYDLRGWDDQGIPKPETLRNLGLTEDALLAGFAHGLNS